MNTFCLQFISSLSPIPQVMNKWNRQWNLKAILKQGKPDGRWLTWTLLTVSVLKGNFVCCVADHHSTGSEKKSVSVYKMILNKQLWSVFFKRIVNQRVKWSATLPKIYLTSIIPSHWNGSTQGLRKNDHWLTIFLLTARSERSSLKGNIKC